MSSFIMKENGSVEEFKIRFHNKLILSGRDKTKGDLELLKQDQLIWFKRGLSKKWALECVN